MNFIGGNEGELCGLSYFSFLSIIKISNKEAISRDLMLRGLDSLHKVLGSNFIIVKKKISNKGTCSPSHYPLSFPNYLSSQQILKYKKNMIKLNHLFFMWNLFTLLSG